MMEPSKIQSVLSGHALWLINDATGIKADLGGADLRSADLRSADLRSADLGGADLRSADLRGADLRGADLEGADLEGANLRGANLRGADLRGADLEGADLEGANLRGARGIFNAGIDSRGYEFIAVIQTDGIRIKAGCRWFTFDEAEKHWATKNNSDALARVVLLKTLSAA